MSDPAVEAAQRYWHDARHRVWSDIYPGAKGLSADIAREALAPIRELVEKWIAPTIPGLLSNGAPDARTCSAEDFIAELRELIYPSEEL